MRDRVAIATVAVVAASLLAAGYRALPGEQRAGQVILVPARDAPPGAADPRAGTITVLNCEDGPTGLSVVGRVNWRAAPVSVAVWPANPRLPGVRRSLGEAWGLTQVPGADFGDFVIVIPWARSTSHFAVTMDTPGGQVHGKAARCP